MATLREQIATNVLTVTRFRELMRKLRETRPNDDLALVKKAYEFSQKHHTGQTRASGEPYLVHPLEVGLVLADMKMDAVAVVAGLLHDSVEDTSVTTTEIRQEFGEQVAHIVEGVTKISKIDFSSREEAQAENLRKMMLAMVDDIRVVLIKLADRLHNIRTLHYVPEHRQHIIARETLDIYAPIAARLGIGTIRSELEDLAFRLLEAGPYERLRERVDDRLRQIGPSLERLRSSIEAKLSETSIPIISVEGRTKDLYSLNRKMHRLKLTLDQVNDLLAVRIVTKTITDCYAALGVIHNVWRPVPGHVKDFIAMPRPKETLIKFSIFHRY